MPRVMVDDEISQNSDKHTFSMVPLIMLLSSACLFFVFKVYIFCPGPQICYSTSYFLWNLEFFLSDVLY